MGSSPNIFSNPYDYTKEVYLSNVPASIPAEKLLVISKQCENTIIKIESNQKGKGTGFFCMIPFPDKSHPLPVLITNYHVFKLNDNFEGEIIKFSLNNDKFKYEIKLDSRKTFSNEKFDITIIEIKENDGININTFLDIDYQIFDDNPDKNYKKGSVYLLHYPKGLNIEYSPGLIKGIATDNYNIEHQCQSEFGSSGAPIINSINNDVIGIHKGHNNKVSKINLGTFLKLPILKFYEESGKKQNKDIIINKEDEKNKNKLNEFHIINNNNNNINNILENENNKNIEINQNNNGKNNKNNNEKNKNIEINQNKNEKNNDIISNNNFQENNDFLSDEILNMLYDEDEKVIKDKLFTKNDKNYLDEMTIIYSKFNIKSSDFIFNLKFKITSKETFSENKLFGEKFVRNNENICTMIINGKEYKLSSYLESEYNKNIDFLELKLKGINRVTNMFCMFCGCIIINICI